MIPRPLDFAIANSNLGSRSRPCVAVSTTIHSERMKQQKVKKIVTTKLTLEASKIYYNIMLSTTTATTIVTMILLADNILAIVGVLPSTPMLQVDTAFLQSRSSLTIPTIAISRI